jgi:hypothetical protein
MIIIFCLPGSNFSNHFLKSWTETVTAMPSMGITPIVSMAQDSVVYYARNKCLGGDVLKGRHQIPWQGQIKYDYQMWIDSDMVWSPDHIKQLISHNLPIVAGSYPLQGGKKLACVPVMDDLYYARHGTYQFADPSRTGLVKVDYTGFGFILIKHGVVEELEYPWFRPIYSEIGGTAYDFCSEDVGICMQMRRAGYDIHVDYDCRIGHQKTIIY